MKIENKVKKREVYNRYTKRSAGMPRRKGIRYSKRLDSLAERSGTVMYCAVSKQKEMRNQGGEGGG